MCIHVYSMYMYMYMYMYVYIHVYCTCVSCSTTCACMYVILSTHQPLLLGKARVPFRQRLMARSSASRVEVEVQRSVVGADCGGTVADTETENTTEITVGKLTVCTCTLHIHVYHQLNQLPSTF